MTNRTLGFVAVSVVAVLGATGCGGERLSQSSKMTLAEYVPALDCAVRIWAAELQDSSDPLPLPTSPGAAPTDAQARAYVDELRRALHESGWRNRIYAKANSLPIAKKWEQLTTDELEKGSQLYPRLLKAFRILAEDVQLKVRDSADYPPQQLLEKFCSPPPSGSAQMIITGGLVKPPRW